MTSTPGEEFRKWPKEAFWESPDHGKRWLLLAPPSMSGYPLHVIVRRLKSGRHDRGIIGTVFTERVSGDFRPVDGWPPV